MDGQIYGMNTEMEVKGVEMVTGDVDAGPDAESGEQEEVVERSYVLRTLKDKDLFPMLKILKKIGIKDFKNAFIQNQANKQSVEGKDIIKNMGILTAFDMADILLGNLEKAEDEIYALWSDISNIPIAEMKEMEFGTLPLMILDTFSNMRNSSFFKVLSKFLS
ncbi:MAG: hypothetical protein K2N80_05120 [Lachnospiraceae bacterium]|nr:hypothetical protein [Lachnospiraceae bacterium]